MQFIGLLSDGRGGLCVTLIRRRRRSWRHLSRCGSVTTRLWMPLASIHYRVAASLPRGEGKGLVFFVILKTYRYQYVFGYKQSKNIPRARLPLGGKVSPSECDGRRMRGNVQFFVKQFDKPKSECPAIFCDPDRSEHLHRALRHLQAPRKSAQGQEAGKEESLHIVPIGNQLKSFLLQRGFAYSL